MANQHSKKVYQQERVREAGEDPRYLSQSDSDGIIENARYLADMHTLPPGRKAGADGAAENVELLVKFVDDTKDFDELLVSQSPKRKKRKKQNGLREGCMGQYEAPVEETPLGVSRMQVDQEESDWQTHVFDNEGSCSSTPRSRLELVRLLQNRKIPRLRKIEVICKFIKDLEQLVLPAKDRSCLRVQVTNADMGMPQFLSFLSEWVQHAILWSSKSEEILPGGPISPLHDSRYWDTLGWCLSSRDLPQSASVSPGLMRCLNQYVNSRLDEETTDGTWMTEDSVKAIEVLLLANQRSFRPDLDNWVSLASTAMRTLSFRDEWFAEDRREKYILMLRLFVNILEGFSRFIAIYPNRKKTFLCLVDNLLEPLLFAHAYLTLPSDYEYLTPASDLIVKMQEDEVKVWKKRFLKVTQDILEKGLFHPVHIGSFHEVCTFLAGQVDGRSEVRRTKVDLRKVGRLKKVDEERDMASYQKLLFRKLDRLREDISAKNEHGLVGTQIGWIFETYSRNLTSLQAADALEILGLNAKGKLQVTPNNAAVEKIVDGTEEASSKLPETSSGGSQSVHQTDQNREARFRVFAELTGPIVTDLQACWSATKRNDANQHLSRAEVLLGAFTGLLRAAVSERTYVPTEDSAKQTQFTFFSKCFGVVLDFGNLLPGLLNDSDVSISQIADSRPQGGHVQGTVDKPIPRYLIERLLREIILATAHILELEYRVADNVLDDVWAILLHGGVLEELCKKEGRAEIASQEADRVACQIISTYSDLRQVDRALFSLSRTLRRFIDLPSTLASGDAPWSFSPSLEASGFLVCAKSFLSAVSSAVHTLPEGQVAEFIRLLTAELLDTATKLEETSRSKQGGLEVRADYNSNNLLSQIGLVELYSCVLESVNVTPTNSLLCCKAVGSLMKELVTPYMGELIDSFCNSGKQERRYPVSTDTGKISERREKEVEGSAMTWNVIFRLRLFLGSRGIHRHSLHLMPPKAAKKANIALGGYLIDYNKLDVQSVLSRLSAGIFFSAVDRASFKVSDFLAGVRTKIIENELSESPALEYTLDCVAMSGLVDLAKHVEAVSFLVMRYSDLSYMRDGESVSGQLPGQGNKINSPTEAEDVDVELLKRLQKLLKSLKQESRRLAKTLLQGLPSLTQACQLVSESSSKLRCQSSSELSSGHQIPTGSSEIQRKQILWDHVDATLTKDLLTLRRWRLLCQSMDVWAKFAAEKDLKKFLTCLFGCLMLNPTTHVNSRQKDGKTLGSEVTVMQQIANDLLNNASFFEEESIRRLFPFSFLEAFKHLVCSAFGNWPFEWFASDTVFEKEALFRMASEFSDLVEAQVGERQEEKGFGTRDLAKKVKSLVKKRKKWKIEACALDMKALRKCVALVDHLAALPPGYIISREATRCALALQCFERLLVQSLLHMRLTAVDTEQSGTLDASDVFVVVEGLCSCRSSLLALTATGVECLNHSECSMSTVLSGSFALVQWLSQSLHATTICLVDIVEYSNLSENEKLNKLSDGQNLLHISLKYTASLFTYIYNESLQREVSKLYGNPSELASASSGGNKDNSNLAADGNGVVNVKSFLDELLTLQGTKIDELLRRRVKAGQISNSDRFELAEGLCREDFGTWFSGLVSAASLCSYFWRLVSSFEKYSRDGFSPESQLMFLRESGGKIDTLGHLIMKSLVRAVVPDGSYAMLLVGEDEVDRNLQWTALEATEVKDGALRPQSLQDGDFKKKAEDEEDSDGDNLQTTSDLIAHAKQDIQDESEEEEEGEDDDVPRDDLRDVEILFKAETQDKIANGIDLEGADYSSKSAVQRVALETLLEGHSTGMCDLVGELFLAAAGFLKFEALRLSCRKEESKFSGGLPPGGSVLLGAGCWILLRAAKQMRAGQCAKFGWLVGVVRYMESVGSLLPHVKSPLTASAFSKLFNMHLYLLGSLSPADIKHHSEPLDAVDQLELSIGVELPSDGMTKDEMKGKSDVNLREAVRVSLGLLMKTASRHHLVLALQAITRALVGASEDPYSSSGLELCGHESGKVGRGVAAGVQSLSVALETVSGTKRLRLLANHFKEFSGAIFNLIECLAGPKLFHNQVRGHHGAVPTEVQTGMVQSAPVLLRCIQILTNVASRETIYPLRACHVALALHCPAIIFSSICQSGLSKDRLIRGILAHDNSGVKQEKEVYARMLVIGTDVGVELYVACCRLLCSLIRHRRRESGHCIALLGDSARVLLHCLEATYWPISDESTKVWSTRMATYCATWLRRIYEEMGEHKETLGKYCCHMLSHYLSVLAGHGKDAVGLTREIEAALRPGAYALVDACSANDMQQLHASLGEGPRRNALLALRREYTQQFKYTGKV